MKRIHMIAAAAALLVCLASCRKEGADLFRGDYSYSFGGDVELEEIVQPTESEETPEPAVRSVSLASERGFMQVLDAGDGMVKLTLRPRTGSAWTFDASVDGETLTIVPFTRTVTLSPGGSSQVRISGTGRLVDGSLVFDLECGDFTVGFVEVSGWTEYRATGSDITFFASPI